MYYLGFDIGGTKSAAVLGDENGNILHREAIPTGSPTQTMERLFQAAEVFPERAKAAGVSCGGPLDEDGGLILSPPNLPGWDRINIVEMIQNRFGIPTRLRNDANACALAEWRFGAGKGAQSMIFLTFGTGMGAGLILNGKLYAGICGLAGEVGHIRLAPDGPEGYGKAGSFEGFVSGGGIARMGQSLAKERLRQGNPTRFCPSTETLSSITAKSLAQAAKNGDPDAIKIFRLCGEKLGAGLAILIDLLNPERIVIGSIFQRSEGLLRPSMEEVLRRECLPGALEAVQILSAELGDRIGDIAALTVAMEDGGAGHV